MTTNGDAAPKTYTFTYEHHLYLYSTVQSGRVRRALLTAARIIIIKNQTSECQTGFAGLMSYYIRSNIRNFEYYYENYFTNAPGYLLKIYIPAFTMSTVLSYLTRSTYPFRMCSTPSNSQRYSGTRLWLSFIINYTTTGPNGAAPPCGAGPRRASDRVTDMHIMMAIMFRDSGPSHRVPPYVRLYIPDTRLTYSLTLTPPEHLLVNTPRRRTPPRPCRPWKAATRAQAHPGTHHLTLVFYLSLGSALGVRERLTASYAVIHPDQPP